MIFVWFLQNTLIKLFFQLILFIFYNITSKMSYIKRIIQLNKMFVLSDANNKSCCE